MAATRADPAEASSFSRASVLEILQPRFFGGSSRIPSSRTSAISIGEIDILHVLRAGFAATREYNAYMS